MADSRATAALAAEKPMSRLGSGRDCHHLGGISSHLYFGCYRYFVSRNSN
jgi:hypothetical protein